MDTGVVDERGTTRVNPDYEQTMLYEENFQHLRGTRFVRALTSFTFFLNGKICTIDVLAQTATRWAGVTVLGVVGTLSGKAGLFAQAGWFASCELDWFWVTMTDISGLAVTCDPRFRKGQPSVWLTTALGDYAMLFPHEEYADDWDATLHILGHDALSAKFVQQPAAGPRPYWWEDAYQEFWPLKENMPPEASINDKADVAGPVAKWGRIWASNEDRRQTGFATNLSQLEPWSIEFDGGIKPSHGRLSHAAKRGRSRGSSRGRR